MNIISVAEDFSSLTHIMEMIAPYCVVVSTLAVVISAAYVAKQVSVATGSQKFSYAKSSTDIIHNLLLSEDVFSETTDGMKALNDAKKKNSRFFYDYMSAEDKNRIRIVCNKYELLATCCITGALDEQIFRRFWEGTLIDHFGELKEFIKEERKFTGNEKLFVDFESLAGKWQ